VGVEHAICALTLGLLAAPAAAGQDAPFAAWEALASVALQDLTLLAQQLPQRTRYTWPRPVVLSLAYRRFQDAKRATQLVALNDAPHPLSRCQGRRCWRLDVAA